MGALAFKPMPANANATPAAGAAFAVDGRIVLIDYSDFNFDGRTEAVVIRQDETIGIEKPVPYGRGIFGGGPRMSAYGVGQLTAGRYKSIQRCTVIGRVIDPE